MPFTQTVHTKSYFSHKVLVINVIAECNVCNVKLTKSSYPNIVITYRNSQPLRKEKLETRNIPVAAKNFSTKNVSTFKLEKPPKNLNYSGHVFQKTLVSTAFFGGQLKKLDPQFIKS